MNKNGKEYSLVDLDNDPEWDFYCDGTHCINRLGYTGLEELTPLDFSQMSMAERCSLSYAERKPIRKVYCLHCMEKMFTEDEIKALEDEARERYRKHLEEYHRECVRNGYGHCM